MTSRVRRPSDRPFMIPRAHGLERSTVFMGMTKDGRARGFRWIYNNYSYAGWVNNDSLLVPWV